METKALRRMFDPGVRWKDEGTSMFFIHLWTAACLHVKYIDASDAVIRMIEISWHYAKKKKKA